MPNLVRGSGRAEIRDVSRRGSEMDQFLRSPEMRSLVRDSAEQVEALYRARVAKRTGQLARETRIETFIGGRHNDRWCARLIAYAPYAAAHEFGNERGRAHNELRQALNSWEAMQ